MVNSVLADWKTADVDEKTQAMLGFLEKLTLNPADVVREDVTALRSAGVSPQAMLDAVYVCALFNLIDRVADALDFEPIPPAVLPRAAKVLIAQGYE